MKISQKFYVSESIYSKDQIIALLCNGFQICGLFLICSLENSKNTFEIFESKYIFRDFNKNKCYTLVGLAMGKAEAFLLLEKIFKENLT